MINEYSLSNKDEAINDFSNIINNFPQESLTRFAKRELSKLGIEINYKQNQNIFSQKGDLEFSTNSYPNPFNPSTIINYTLPTDGKVVIRVYDILGREVAELVNEFKTAGKYSVQFNGSNLASGIYFYRIGAGKFSQTKKLVLTK